MRSAKHELIECRVDCYSFASDAAQHKPSVPRQVPVFIMCHVCVDVLRCRLPPLARHRLLSLAHVILSPTVASTGVRLNRCSYASTQKHRA